jgi:hypothetical protein
MSKNSDCYLAIFQNDVQIMCKSFQCLASCSMIFGKKILDYREMVFGLSYEGVYLESGAGIGTQWYTGMLAFDVGGSATSIMGTSGVFGIGMPSIPSWGFGIRWNVGLPPLVVGGSLVKIMCSSSVAFLVIA